mmetsp:Transcript_25479/g.60611  ORF Transcript_25479/g.60611 Transcript_25479/m.60611 type:complete len:124 (+) Transcript_25479:231-602(+)
MTVFPPSNTSYPRPTYFEILAAEELTTSLKTAVVYSLSVFSQRHSWVHRLLDYEDELWAAIAFLVNSRSLVSSDATYAEALYGLKRVRFLRDASETYRGELHARSRLTNRQRVLCLALTEPLL